MMNTAKLICTIVLTCAASLAHATGLRVVVAKDPLNCVALGAGRALEDLSYRGVLHPA